MIIHFTAVDCALNQKDTNQSIESGLHFFYYSSNGPAVVEFNGTRYGCVHSLQGDIYQIIAVNETVVVEHIYDAWDKMFSTTGTMMIKFSMILPFHYSGYVYDVETGLYYLRNRYYISKIGRFLNADGILLSSGDDQLCKVSLYSYCESNPVIRQDKNGRFWHLIVGAIIGVVTQYVCDVATNLAEGNSLVDSLAVRSSWVDYGSAAISGALAATGIGCVASITANAAISGTTYVLDCVLNEETPDISNFAVATAIGGVGGAIGGKGVNGSKLRGITKTSQKVLKTAVSAKKIMMYTAKIASAKTTAIVGAIRTVAASFSVNVFSAGRRKMFESPY